MPPYVVILQKSDDSVLPVTADTVNEAVEQAAAILRDPADGWVPQVVTDSADHAVVLTFDALRERLRARHGVTVPDSLYVGTVDHEDLPAG